MDMQPSVLEFIVCPQCQGDQLTHTREQVVFCPKCRLCFPIRDGIPILNMDEAMNLNAEGEVLDRDVAAVYTLTDGKDAGVTFRLHKGHCKVIGRRLDDSLKTQIFNVDFTMSLDEHTKSLIMNYLAKSRQQQSDALLEDPTELGTYQRLPDLVVDDLAVSRLHAILFFDEMGAGILDLVSKNGTFVNGKEVETACLKSGDVIEVGATKIKLAIK